jgi:hypothetical protein
VYLYITVTELYHLGIRRFKYCALKSEVTKYFSGALTIPNNIINFVQKIQKSCSLHYCHSLLGRKGQQKENNVVGTLAHDKHAMLSV